MEERRPVDWWWCEVLKGDEIHQVAFGWSHAVREEVDQGVKELRSLGVGLVYVRETCRATGKKISIYMYSVRSLIASKCSKER